MLNKQTKGIEVVLRAEDDIRSVKEDILLRLKVKITSHVTIWMMMVLGQKWKKLNVVKRILHLDK